jgi:tetratricopeptide (TPR) repeat protein
MKLGLDMAAKHGRRNLPAKWFGLCPWLLIALAMQLSLVDRLSAATNQQLLTQAIDQYRAALDTEDRDERLQRFHHAEMLFARIADGSAQGEGNGTSGVQNADLLVNLGNSALGAERIGPAIVAYRRALTIDPDHRQARQNLNHARRLLPDWVPRPEEGGILDTFLAWTGHLSRTEQQLAAAVLFFAAAILLAASIRWRRSALRNLALLPATLWVLLILMLMHTSANSAAEPAVIVAPETVARAADSDNAPVRFRQALPSGTEVDVMERRGSWSHIKLADGRDAWVHRSALESV